MLAGEHCAYMLYFREIEELVARLTDADSGIVEEMTSPAEDLSGQAQRLDIKYER